MLQSASELRRAGSFVEHALKHLGFGRKHYILSAPTTILGHKVEITGLLINASAPKARANPTPRGAVVSDEKPHPSKKLGWGILKMVGWATRPTGHFLAGGAACICDP